MIPEDENEGERDAPPPDPPARPLPPAMSPVRGVIVMVAAVLLPIVVIGLSVFSMMRDTVLRGGSEPVVTAPPRATPGTTSLPSELGAPTETAPATAPTETAPAVPPSALAVQPAEQPLTDFYEDTDDGEPEQPVKRAPPRVYKTVHQAATESCTTASVEALSRQIIEQARCMKPNAFVPLPSRKNLVLASNVFPYLEQDARNHLLRALDAHAQQTMTINSALRTVAQQYLVSRWASGRRCGVQLATRPGDSNHEIGAALDIAEPATWRPALEKENFAWLGASDRVHFDFKGATGPSGIATDVLAFQTLWNRNNPTDKIGVSGRYDSATEQRMKKAPPGGFALGPSCGKSAGQKK